MRAGWSLRAGLSGSNHNKRSGQLQPLRTKKYSEEQMKKQITKAFVMVSLVSLLTLAAAVQSAQAQSRINYTANIPFAFTVGNTTLPPGLYTVTEIKTADGAGILQVSAKGKDGVFRLTDRVQVNKPRAKTVLVFNQYGEQYFLAEMWRRGESEGRLVRKSNRERAIESELARTRGSQNETARRAAQPQTVELALLAK